MAVIAVIAAAIGYLLVRLNYGALPSLPRLAGVTAALLGIGEAIAGWGLRGRIRSQDDHREGARGATAPSRPPVPPLTAARALAVAKASALAGAALLGLWAGVIGYVAPRAGVTSAAASDTGTAVLGAVCALILIAGALFLEYCCRVPPGGPPAP